MQPVRNAVTPTLAQFVCLHTSSTERPALYASLPCQAASHAPTQLSASPVPTIVTTITQQIKTVQFVQWPCLTAWTVPQTLPV